jgi:hypothetical protein
MENEGKTAEVEIEVKPAEQVGSIESGGGEENNMHESCKMLKGHFADDNITTEQDALDKLQWLLDYFDKSQDANKVLNDIFEQEPELIKSLAELANGKHKSLPAALASNYPIELFVPTKGDPSSDEMTANINERAAKQESIKKSQSEFKDNLSKSMDALEVFKNSEGIPDEDFKEFTSLLDDVLILVINGTLNQSAINTLYKGFIHDRKTTEMYNEGKKDGLNAKIMVVKSTKEMPSGDMLPNISTTSDNIKLPEKEKSGIEQDWQKVLKIEK